MASLLSPFLRPKTAGDTERSYAMQGKLYASSGGWVLLSVPNSLVHGVFDAMGETGIELPPGHGEGGRLDAHITVIRKDELGAIGGPDKISERGHMFRYTLGELRTAVPNGWPEMSRVWMIEVKSPELEKLRKSYGLSALPKNNQFAFHITCAVRRKNVHRDGDVTKASSENTDVGVIPPGECCPHCDARLERGDNGNCNRCGKPWPKEAAFYTRQELLAAGKTVNTEPTEAQREAGNYQKAHVHIHGLDIAIENPKGSTRSGTSASGKRWSTLMKSHYGYIKGTEGKDGDHVDVFIGDNPESQLVFVVDQVNPETGYFDEHKCMLGFHDLEEARTAYLSNYEKDWQGLGAITGVTFDQFKNWLSSGDTTKRLNGIMIKLAETPIYQRAFSAQMANPTWTHGAGLAQNFGRNITQWHSRGSQMVNDVENAEYMKGQLDPNYGWERLRGMLSGRVSPGPANPIDRALFQQ